MKNTTKRKIELKQSLIKMLGSKCVDCGNEYHFSAMDFDHTDPSTKKFAMAPLIGRAASGEPKHIDELMEELKKCVLRCANCHRVKTWVNRENLSGKAKTKKHKKKWMFQ